MTFPVQADLEIPVSSVKNPFWNEGPLQVVFLPAETEVLAMVLAVLLTPTRLLQAEWINGIPILQDLWTREFKSPDCSLSRHRLT